MLCERESGTLWATIERYDRDLARILAERVIYQFTNDQVRMISGRANPEPGEDKLRLACASIEEHFDTCLQHLAPLLGWRTVPYERLNVSDKSQADLLPPCRHVVRDANEWLTTKDLPRHLT